MKEFSTQDSGKRQVESSGFQRDTQEGKPRFYLLYPKGVPYNQQPLTRFAQLLERGAQKYESRNWEKANSKEALERAKESMLRHASQAVCDETDEDHLAAVMFNAMFIMVLQWRLNGQK